MSETPLPEPPSPPQRRVRAGGRRPTIDRQAVLDAAMRILDAEGLEAVTLRRVAHELGVGAASLYSHVDSKDALVELMLDQVIGEIEISDLPDERPWQEQLKDLMRRSRETYASHGDISRATLGFIPTGPNALNVMETALAVLRLSGLPDQVIAYAADLFGLVVGAAAYEESLFRQQGIAFDEVARFVEDMRRYLGALPAERFPNVVELAAPLTRFNPDEDERFEFMLNVIVSGLAAQS